RLRGREPCRRRHCRSGKPDQPLRQCDPPQVRRMLVRCSLEFEWYRCVAAAARVEHCVRTAARSRPLGVLTIAELGANALLIGSTFALNNANRAEHVLLPHSLTCRCSCDYLPKAKEKANARTNRFLGGTTMLLVDSRGRSACSERSSETGNAHTLRLTALAAAVGCLTCGPLPAQETGIEEVVVTARFREENIQSSPIA